MAQSLVHFASELVLPPADRQRKARSLYPKVAQVKGSSERRSSYDLFWRWGKLSSVSPNRCEYSSIQRMKGPAELVIEGNDDCVILFNTSEEIQQNACPTLSLTGSMTLTHAIRRTAADNIRTKSFGCRHPTHSPHRANKTSLYRSVAFRMSGTSLSDDVGISAFDK
ncbi:hypothetical protein BS17DRAFT_598491 [Gyrodon lividus]|nr:hypothetical protein BS17DRAFT_598491 [Gyrodon lividus]